jgi:hypothetical protein
MLNTRWVRKLHLTAASEDLIRRGALLLEDALHTASLPESDGRLLVVKSLDVGAIHADLSSASLALSIEERLRGVIAVHASDPAAHLREAVYFHDDAEPSILLALRLARRESTSAWFWRLAVPSWKPEMSLDESLRAIFFTATRTKAGLAAAARLVEDLAQHGALDPLLTALRPQDGTGLMRAFGWSKPVKIATVQISASIPALWKPFLARWIPRWGRDDARVLWLAGVALVAENPIRMLDGDLMTRAAEQIEHIVNNNVGAQCAAPVQAKFDDRTNAGAGLRPVQAKDRVIDTRAQRDPPLQTTNMDTPDDAKSDGQTIRSSERDAATIVGAHGDRRKSLWDGAPSQTPKIKSPEFTPAPWPHTPLETQHAGLFFLIPVLTRLGIAEFLTPELIEAAFPFYLLRTIGQRLGLPDDDPIRTVLATDAPFDPQINFVAPESWQNGIANPGEPIVRQIGGKNVRFDSSGRLALAVEDNIAIGFEPIAAERSNPLKGLNSETTSGLDFDLAEGFEPSAAKTDLLCHTWMTATRRWLRRNARLGLADLVLRPGRITATRTHIDLFFDLAQADIRVRRAGLDINPGWVAWMGRVVSYHYQEGTP